MNHVSDLQSCTLSALCWCNYSVAMTQNIFMICSVLSHLKDARNARRSN